MTKRDTTAPSWSSAFTVGLLLIVFAGAAWMFSTATLRALNSDEILTVRSVGLPFVEMLEERAQCGHSPVYFSLMWVCTRVVGDGELALRAPGIVSAALSAAVLALLVASIGGRNSGLMAAVLLFLHPSYFFFGRLARPYSLTLLLMLSSTLLIAVMARGDRQRHTFFLVALTVLGVHTHSSAFLIIVGQLIWCGSRLRSMRPAFIALIAGAASYVPWLLFAHPWDTLGRNLGWTLEMKGAAVLRIVDVWHQAPSAAPVWQLVFPLLALTLAVWGFRKTRGSDLRWLLLDVSLVPVVLAFIVLRLGIVNLFASERYLLISIAGWVGFSALAVCIGGGRVGFTKPLRAILLTILVTSMAAGQFRLVTASNVTWREVVAAIDKHVKNGRYGLLLLPELTVNERRQLDYYLLQSSCPGRVKVAFTVAGGPHGKDLFLEDPFVDLKLPGWVDHLVLFVGLDPPVEARDLPWVRGLMDRGFSDVAMHKSPRGTLVSLVRADTASAPRRPTLKKERPIKWQKLHGQ